MPLSNIRSATRAEGGWIYRCRRIIRRRTTVRVVLCRRDGPFLDNQIQMALGVLIIFQMAANAAELINETQQMRDAQSSMVEGLAMTWIRHVTRGIGPATRKYQHTSRIQAGAELLQNRGLAVQRHMLDAVPC